MKRNWEQDELQKTHRTLHTPCLEGIAIVCQADIVQPPLHFLVAPFVHLPLQINQTILM